MERVTGIGGVFFRARDPSALGAWYADHLGISLEDHGHSLFTAEAGDATVWSPFAADTEYFGRPDQQWMVNFRVRDLDAMLAQLRADGADVDENVEEYEFGRVRLGDRSGGEPLRALATATGSPTQS